MAAVSGGFKRSCTLLSLDISESALRIGSVLSLSLHQPVHIGFLFSFLSAIATSDCNWRIVLVFGSSI